MKALVNFAFASGLAFAPIPAVHAEENAEIVGTWLVTTCASGTSVEACRAAEASDEFFPIFRNMSFHMGHIVTADDDIVADHGGHGVWEALGGNRFAFMLQIWEFPAPIVEGARAAEAERMRATITLDENGDAFHGTYSFDELDRDGTDAKTTFSGTVIVGERMKLIREDAVFP